MKYEVKCQNSHKINKRSHQFEGRVTEQNNAVGCSGVPMTGLGNHFINKDLQSTNLANLFMEALVI